MRDDTLLKDLKGLREKKAKKEEEKKYSIICDHVLLYTEPKKTVYIKRDPIHPKDTGKTFLCEGCAIIFDNQVMNHNPAGFQAVEDKFFRKNVINYQ